MARLPVSAGMAVAASGAVVAAVVFGALIIEGPEQQRERRFDRARVANLDHIASGIDCYRTLNGALPSDLPTLVVEMERVAQQKPLRDLCVPRRIRDPETEEPYRYREVDDTRFELCASFSLPGEEVGDMRFSSWQPGAARDWKHDPGPQCFDLTAVETKQPIFD